MAEEQKTSGGITEFLASKVIGPLTSFCTVGVIAWNINLNAEVAVLKDHEQTETKIINEFINQQRITFERDEMNIQDIKVKMTVIDTKLNDLENLKAK